MYRIRLESGEEAVYRTVQELAQAVSSGMVSPTAEVYHKAANRWLPINSHPDYRAAIITGKQTAINPRIVLPNTPPGGAAAIPAPPAKPEAPPATSAAQATVRNPGIHLTPPAEPLEGETSRLPALDLTLLPGSEPTLKQAAIPPEVAPDFPAEAELLTLDATPLEVAPPRPDRAPFWNRTRIQAIAGVAAGIMSLAILGAVLLLRRPGAAREIVVDSVALAAGMRTDSLRDSTLAAAATATPTSTPPPPDTVLVVAPPVPTYPAPSQPLPAPRPPVQRDTAPAPRTLPPPVVSRLKSTVNRMPSYYQAYADARSEMDESLNYVNFRRVFATARLTTPDSLRATKRMVVAAGNILRVYRGREVQLEQTYRADDPDGRNSLREPFETSQAARALLDDVDSLFAILVSQQGEITVSETEVRFRNGRIARAYNDVRRDIAGTISAWRDSAEAANRVTMPRLVQALGPALPPPGR